MLEKPQTVAAQSEPGEKVAKGPTVSSFMQRGGTVVVVGPPTPVPVGQEKAE
jgi:hypothetical protein